jgi:hypothetical protein
MPTAAAIEAAIQFATGSDSASDSPQASPASGGDSGAESAPDAVATPQSPPAAQPPNGADRSTEEARETKRSLLSERLAEVRERRAAARLDRQAREQADHAKKDREAAAAERAKWEGLRNGTFLDGMKALGKDPREVFEQMKQEAVEAGKPEAQIRQMQERFDKLLAETVEPLKKTIEGLREEKKQTEAREQAREESARFSADFDRTMQSPDFAPLRIEYGDERLVSMVRSFVTNPGSIVQHAKALKVELTHDDGRFSMREALTVLKRAQEEHEAQKQRRAQAVAPPSQPAPAPAGKKPTVNGTQERADNPLGNEPASSRASNATGKSPSESRRQRVQRLIDEGGGS